ncbi:MAG: CAP domain-containing protein [Flavobacterium sp.]
MKTSFFNILVSVSLVLSLTSCSTASVEEIPMTNKIAEISYNYSEDDIELARVINEYRESIGLNKLELANYASLKSEEHDDYMIEKNAASHANFPERAEAITNALGAKRVNENVAYNFATAKSVLNAWLASPGHKSNIEGDFTHFGIAIKASPTTGKKYYTNIFIKM